MVCSLAIIFLLISLFVFFRMQSFRGRQPQLADSVSAAAEGATEQIHLPAQAVSKEPLQPLQAALKRMG